MKDIVKKFISDISVNGVSKSDVKLLEDTVGEPIISSVVNIKGLTTERSFIGLESVVEVVEEYHEVLRTKSVSEIFDIRDVIESYEGILNTLNKVTSKVKEISELYSEEIKNKILNSEYKYSFISYSGEKIESAYDLFSAKAPITSLLYNNSLYENLTNTDIARYIELKASNIKNNNVNYVDNEYNLESFLLFNLIFNKELESYVNHFNLTPTVLTGKNLIEFLDDVYCYKEYLEEYTKIVTNEHLRDFQNLKHGAVYSINKFKRYNTITISSRNTIDFLEMILILLQGMCKQ